MHSDNQTEQSHAGQAQARDRASNPLPYTQNSMKRPSTPQHYRDNPHLLKSVFEWSPEDTQSTPVEEDEVSSKGGRQPEEPSAPTRSLRRITKKIPDRTPDTSEILTNTSAKAATLESDSKYHTTPGSFTSSRTASTFTIHDGSDPFVQTDTDTQPDTARSQFGAVSSIGFSSRLGASSSTRPRGSGTGR